MTLDSVHNRMFVPEPGNIRVLVYQLDDKGRHVRHTADHVVGHRSLLGRRRQSQVNRTDGAGGAETGLAYDHAHQRLFVRDRSRILVFDVHPDRLQDYPSATHVIGQPDFETMTPGTSSRKFRGAELVIDDDNQRLFLEDGERILVFDIDPARLANFPEATHVIGQPDFGSRLQGLGPNRLTRAHGLALDPDEQRLFVSDQRNNRILIFDVLPSRLKNDPDAIGVMGQPDFHTNTSNFTGAKALVEDRRGTRHITPGGLDYDRLHKRLFVSQLVDNRILVFDASPGATELNPDAIAVLGQPDFTTFDPQISQTRFTFPKDPSLDSEKQVLYVSEGFPGGNRVMAFDISPEELRNGAPAIDVIGHVDDMGRDDFNRRMANDRLDARTTTMARAVALDPVDHRLWVADEYNNRVLGFQLDRHNRLLEREARWVIGQENFYRARADRSVTGIKIPLALAYDRVDKRLYLGDGWNDRVLIYDVHPDRLQEGGNQKAIVVLGQPDFDTQDARATRNRFNFAVDLGNGIASNRLPVGIAIDAEKRRAFISDGGNNRVLVFDIDKNHLHNGADAIAVLGQPDFTSNASRLTPDGLNSPSHLDYDPDHNRLFVVDNRNQRVLVYDTPVGIENGLAAGVVIGQPDFTSTARLRMATKVTTTFQGGSRATSPQDLRSPNGIAYDRIKQRLYVADQGNDRVLVFDASPNRLIDYPIALAALGQRTLESHSDQVTADLSAQDQLYDPRGLAFDSENQQLYVADSHWARLMVFNFPSSSRSVRVPALGTTMYSSLDASVVLQSPDMNTGYGRLSLEAGAHAAYLLTRSTSVMDPITEQQSRVLISQTGARPGPAARRHLVFADGRNGARTTVSIVNLGDRPLTTEFTLQSEQGATNVISRKLQAGQSLLVSDVADLMGTTFDTAGLTVESDAPTSVTAWSRMKNRDGEEILTALPVVSGRPEEPANVLSHVTVGGGYQTDIVLLHTGAEAVRGMLVMFDEFGKELQSQAYTLAPGAVSVWQPAAAGLIPRHQYIVVHPESGMAPVIASLVHRSDKGLITLTGAGTANVLKRAQVPVNTMPDLLRHGRRTAFHLVIANADRQGASVRFILRDLDGREVDRVEQLFLPGMQRDFTLGSLFDMTKFAGSITIISDVPVAVSARQITMNIRGDEILTGIPILQGLSQTPLMFPYVDGSGQSTQLYIVSDDETDIDSEIEFFKTNGEKLEVILR